MKYLSIEQVIRLYGQVIEQTGGTYGIRDLSLLKSAIHAPMHTFEEMDIFPTIEEKAARLAYGIISNHPFVDGNKRVGTHAMLVLLALNNIKLAYSQEELVSKILKIASKEEGYEELLLWVMTHKTSI